MRIELEKAAKKYRQEWVLRNISLQLNSPGSYAVIGPNGAGKSTLLKLLSGYLTPSKGKVCFFDENNTSISTSDIYSKLSYTGPYVDLIEELTLEEAIRFHLKFKPFFSTLTVDSIIIEVLKMEKQRHKPVRYFSSGMKQRLKLALAVCADSPILLLDEPTTNLDRQGALWYHELIQKFGGNRLLVIASNVEEDISFCKEKIDILDFK